jgi:hypothetical protein
MSDALNIGAQAPALAAIARVAQQHPDLPAAYVVANFVVPGEIVLQLDSVADLEPWREALHVASEEVTCLRHGTAGRSRLEFRAAVEGIALDVWVPFTLADAEAVAA